ncbi:hypothetical protein M8818_000535 [Zalaria obscura]|uniref:Uncharacterized protein n=1 Tax=Zalaria obscura TaxID=2024903 RepID=A0ACC3SN62_9PEZI
MADITPAIRLTDPQNHDSVPDTGSPAQTPQRDVEPRESRRPLSSRAGPSGDARSSHLPGITASGNLLRAISNNISGQSSVSGDEDDTTAPRAEASPVMDPLSQQVFNRTQTPPILPPGLLRPVSSATTTNPDDKRSEERRESTGASKSSPLRTDSGLTLHGSKKKGVSFISRFIPGKKKDASEFGSDDESQHSEVRPEGMEAQVFSQPIDNIEYNPSHPQPPAYIKVRARHKKVKDFDRLFLAQELLAKPEQQDPPRSGSMHSSRKRSHAEERGTIWAMEFSRDGRYLAVAGHDKVVRVWAVICSTEDRKTSEGAESKNTERPRMRLSAPVFQSRPIREYEGHTSTVLDLSWSKNNFLLSSSMDKTVRLWHVTRAECLCTFKHNDFVPSIAFHPRDDRFFLAGSLDAKLRLWSIPDKTVAYSTQLPDMITAVAFTPDGKFVMAGCSNGLCMFYETENLKYHTQIVVRSSHGKNAKGSKITGIQAVSWPVGSVNGDIKLLISSNDSRSTPEVAQDPLMLQAGTGQSNLFWNRDIYAEQARGQRPPAEHHSNLEVPGSDRLDRVGSVVSQLTIERSSGDESDSRSRSHSDAGSHLDKR